MKLFVLHFLQKKTFPPEFLEKCKNNSNKPQFLTSEFKIALKMATEQGLYAKVMMIRKKDYDNKKKK